MATSADAIRAGLLTLSAAATIDLADALRRTTPTRAREVLLAVAPGAMGYYTSGSGALAADWFDALREGVAPRSAYRSIVPEWRREEKFSRALVWATEPLDLADPNLAEALSRLGTAVEYETFEAFSDSINQNVQEDPEAIGWSRNANYGTACKFCRMLAERGAVYRKQETAHFAAHTNCQCTCTPEFRGGKHGPEASVIQYQASRRYRTKEQRDANNARIRDYLNKNYPDAPG